MMKICAYAILETRVRVSSTLGRRTVGAFEIQHTQNSTAHAISIDLRLTMSAQEYPYSIRRKRRFNQFTNDCRQASLCCNNVVTCSEIVDVCIWGRHQSVSRECIGFGRHSPRICDQYCECYVQKIKDVADNSATRHPG